MKYLLTISISVFLTFDVASQEQWSIVNQGMDNIPRYVDFVNIDTGWIAADKGLLRTYDGGEHWIKLNGYNHIRGLDFSDGSNGWMMLDHDLDGSGNLIMKTGDGGRTWDTVLVSESGYNSLLALDDNVVFVSSYDHILKTVNGGTSWVNTTPALPWKDYCFLNKDTGFVSQENFPDLVYSTFDGGNTWEEVSLSGLNRLQFIKILDYNNILFKARRFSDGQYILCKTMDQFRTYAELAASDNGVDGLYLDEGSLFAAVDSCPDTYLGQETHILKSTDGGLTWKNTIHPPLRNLNYRIYSSRKGITILATSFGKFMAPGSIAMELVSYDQGDHWVLNKMNFPLRDIQFTDQEKGFIVAGSYTTHYNWGAMLITQDGGSSWNLSRMLDGAGIDLCFADESRGFIFIRKDYGDPGVYSTSDGWDHLEYEKSGEFHGFDFLNDSIGWAIKPNEDYLLCKTTDAGINWEPRYNKEAFPFDINSIFILDEDRGIGVGNEGIIVKFSGEEDMHIIESGTTLPLNKVLFVNQDTGYITSGYGTYHEALCWILMTNNGGESWERRSELPYMIHDLYFLNASHGFAVGEDSTESGVLLETFDSGSTWNEIISGDKSLGAIRSLNFIDGTGWAVGDNSLILKYGTSNTTNIDFLTIKNEIPFHSYPNPFRNLTVISYDLQSATEMELNIYDLSGRKVSTLDNGFRTSGTHEVTWNVPEMDPGIYFCELRTRYNRQVIKMILTK